MTEENIIIITLCVAVFLLLLALGRALSAMLRYRQRVFELTGGKEGNVMSRVVPETPPPPPPSKKRQDLYNDDVIDIDSIQSVKPLISNE